VVLIARNKRDITRFIWILLVILVPFFRSLIYIIVHHASSKLNQDLEKIRKVPYPGDYQLAGKGLSFRGLRCWTESKVPIRKKILIFLKNVFHSLPGIL